MAFANLTSWLINQCGKSMRQPSESDDPNETVFAIVDSCKKLGVDASFPQYKLKSGAGDEAVRLLAALTALALKQKQVQIRAPVYPTAEEEAQQDAEHIEDQEAMDQDTIGAGTLLGGVENDDADAVDSEDSDEEADYARLSVTSATRTTGQKEDSGEGEKSDSLVPPTAAGSDPRGLQQIGTMSFTPVPGASKREVEQLNSLRMSQQLNDEDWRAEVERVQHRLKVVIRPDNRDWRSHVDQLTQLNRDMKQLGDMTSKQLSKLAGDIGKTYDKLQSREKYINKQVTDTVVVSGARDLFFFTPSFDELPLLFSQ